jgi:hypothetical protein
MPRQLSPEAVNSMPLARLSFEAEVFFWHVIAQADDQGRLTGDPRQLRHQCFPAREEVTAHDVTRSLAEVIREGLVLFYVVPDNVPVLQVRSWQEFQRGQRHVYPSRWPAPEGWEDLPVKLPHNRAPERVQSGSGAGPERQTEPTRPTTLQSGSGAAPPSVSVSGSGSGSVSGSVAAAGSGPRSGTNGAAAVIDEYRRMTGRATEGAVAYLNNLVGMYGTERVLRALSAEHQLDPGPKNLLSRMERGLKVGQQAGYGGQA